MSTFSDLFSLFIKSREINVSALTAYCNLDRSTMYKLINGKRTPTSKELVRQIASFMNLNPVETQELVDAYLLTKVGWEAYYRRKNVLDFILNFDELRPLLPRNSDPPPKVWKALLSLLPVSSTCLRRFSRCCWKVHLLAVTAYVFSPSQSICRH